MSDSLISLQGLRVALIGGAGFIGHNMALSMKALGVDVSVIDSLGVNNYYALERERYTNPMGETYLGFVKQRMQLLHEAQVPFIELDARDYHGVSETLREIQPDVIVHLAGMNRGDDKEVESTNIELAASLIEACESQKCAPHIIFSSSTHIDRDTAYGRSKRICAQNLRDWATRNRGVFTNLILPHVFGECGNDHLYPSNSEETSGIENNNSSKFSILMR